MLFSNRQIDGLVYQVPGAKSTTSTQETNTEREECEYANASKILLKRLKPYFKDVRGTGQYWANMRDQLMDQVGMDELASPCPTLCFTFLKCESVKHKLHDCMLGKNQTR